MVERERGSRKEENTVDALGGSLSHPLKWYVLRSLDDEILLMGSDIGTRMIKAIVSIFQLFFPKHRTENRASSRYICGLQSLKQS